MIERAKREDLPAILSLQRLAYLSEAELYDGMAIPPLTQTLEELEQDHREGVVLIVVEGGDIVGSVRAKRDGDSVRIGKLIVHPSAQNRGLGKRLLLEAERLWPDAARAELFMGHRSMKNLAFYRKLGYEPFKERLVDERLTLVFLEKRLPKRERRDEE
ncbi:GNAT family N-acetyltransferase [Paenibacillus sp. FSL W8-1187]|uniref:Histone acetyltransferase HPA2 n=1 Tax=Paenibacillus pasadenensis TaxID=217090 RepID=A0A2N5N0U1_9BACL|nr:MULTISPECIES: GNAT family N-acetyltransferase [Paenibacillus]PLT43951.1 Histone acetyltransferase HPA2 [Paenibacillus pasadenensis]QGG54515.1 GNAT family N-acetyltransferase [Paenibacillus sp. B01]